MVAGEEQPDLDDLPVLDAQDGNPDARIDDHTRDLIRRLVHDQLPTGKLDRRAVQSMAFILLVAGHETTGNTIALGTLALIQHPEQYQALGEALSLAPLAVEELLRYLTILSEPNWRVSKEDTVIGGREIKAGETVVPLTFSAHRDEEHHDNPDTLDIRRGARDHLAFGYGIHQCLGQPLTRVELQVVFSTPARRIPTLRPAVPLEEVPFRTDVDIYGVHTLPATWWPPPSAPCTTHRQGGSNMTTTTQAPTSGPRQPRGRQQIVVAGRLRVLPRPQQAVPVQRSQSRRYPDQVCDRPAVILFRSKSGVFVGLRVKVPVSGMLNLEARMRST
ncbi:cytochrome P450 [Streptomyces sp. NPDC002845]